MNGFAQAFLWCVLQVTLLASAVCAVVLLLRGRSPGVRSSMVLGGLMAILGVTILSFGPWPNWTSSWWERTGTLARAETLPSSDDRSPASTHNSEVPPLRLTQNSESLWQAAWDGFRSGLNAPATPTVDSSSEITGRRILGGLFAAGLFFSLARLIGGWVAVQRMRTHSRRIVDADLREEMEVLQAELGLSAAIEIHESSRIATAATVGWRDCADRVRR